MWYYLAFISLVSIIVCVYDKSAARRRKRRIPEKTLFSLSAIGGALFMFIIMLTIRHKTKHLNFMVLVPLMALVHIGLLLWLQLKYGILF